MDPSSPPTGSGPAGGPADGAPQRFKRILLKLSGEMLAGADARGLDDDAIGFVAAEIASAARAGVEVALVVGAGNLCRGAGPNPSALSVARQKLDAMGMLATAINTIALQDRLQQVGLEAVHMSTLSAVPHARAFDMAEALARLGRGAVLLFSGGTGLPFFSTDTAACVRALQVEAEALFKGTQVDGVYDRDPRAPAAGSAVRLPHVSYKDVLARGLQFMDMSAAALCAQHNLPTVVFNAHGKGNLAGALSGTLPCSLVDNEEENTDA